MTRISIDPRSVLVARPRPEEVPWRLLRLEETKNCTPELTEFMRIAKQGEEVLGGYLLEEPESDSMAWKILRLAVQPEVRRQGLGYWLIGHASGVAEGRGAAQIIVEIEEAHPARRLFERYGYEPLNRQRLCFFTYSE